MTFRRKYFFEHFFEHSKKHLGETQTFLRKSLDEAKSQTRSKQELVIYFFLEAGGADCLERRVKTDAEAK